ncbi:hypothetical protein EXN66_Car006337 [Channa argus]|uniref:Uncharacterized protein n=1 Tax=Channa argus TaxID=215402 RepID=A0A6G1PKJ8_CHAAH|nr:hypothetical protein EXN66_Car006337 [Channa argus]
MNLCEQIIFALAPRQKGQFHPLKSRAHHNKRICTVQENSLAQLKLRGQQTDYPW